MHLTASLLQKLLRASPSMALHISIKNKQATPLAVDLLKTGSVIAVPTDTVYGLACDATNINSINKLYAIKCRDEQKPLAICLGEISEVNKWARIEHLPLGLLESLLPGPVTLILFCANKLDQSLTCQGKVGIRIPDYSFIRALATSLGRPLALTSANVSSEPSSLTIHEFQTLWSQIPAVFDGGSLGKTRLASTIVDLSQVGRFRVVREGIAASETVSILEEFGLCNHH